jgi:hypothetical protein
MSQFKINTTALAVEPTTIAVKPTTIAIEPTTTLAVTPTTIAVTPISPTLLSTSIFLKQNLGIKQVILTQQQNLPLAGTKSGNLFDDRFNTNIKWYLPAYVLMPDPDTFFNFNAIQPDDIPDPSGNTFHTCTLTLSVKKSVPDDVQAFIAANSGLDIREIQLQNLNATLSTSSHDANTGQVVHQQYMGKLEVTPNGDLHLTFENILGSGIIVLYENLQKGGADITITSNYDVWISTKPRPWFGILVKDRMPPITTQVNSSILIKDNKTSSITPSLKPISTIESDPILTQLEISSSSDISDSDTSDDDQYKITSLATSFELPLETKYAANDYALKFTLTLSTASITRPIIDVNALKNFDIKQSEFKELTTLGDIRQRYPSLSRMYMGVLSKTIIVIPASYSIVRTVHGLNTLCLASLDSGSETKCKFQLSFTLAPDVSYIDLLQLSQEISGIEELQGYTVILPNFLKEGSTTKLMSAFQSSAQCFNGIDQHLFSLMVEIRDQVNDSPAVSAANLLITQLCQDREPFLLATISLKLDDNFPDPVEAQVALNFHKSTGTDELTFSVDDNLKTITFLNNSPFDLLISRYAFSNNINSNIVSANLPIKSGESISVSFNSTSEDLSVVVDSEIDITGVIPKADIGKFMLFRAQDVQSTMYTFGINAASVDFDTLGINKIDVQVNLNGLPDISVPQFSLVKLHTVESTSATIPIQNAITSLKANVLFTIHYNGTSKADSQFSVQQEFIDNPIMILQNSDITNNTI